MSANTTPTTPVRRIAVVGLGNAGSALCKPLVKAFTLSGFDNNPERCNAMKKSGVDIHVAASLDALADAADIYLLSLPHAAASDAVINALLAFTTPPDAIIETSTITASQARAAYQRCAQHGVTYVEAAIAGGVAGMAAGKTTFLVGAHPTDFEKVEPVLQSMATTIRHIGAPGSGMGTKVIINAVYHAVMVVLIEAAAMAKKLEVPMSELTSILLSAEGMLRPLTHRIGERIAEGNFEGGMSVANARKDSLLALTTAQELGVPLYTIQAAHTPYEIAKAKGLDDKDYAVLATLWEEWIGERLN